MNGFDDLMKHLDRAHTEATRLSLPTLLFLLNMAVVEATLRYGDHLKKELCSSEDQS